MRRPRDPRIVLDLEEQPVGLVLVLQMGQPVLASGYIVRNLMTWKTLPSRPTRDCRKKAGQRVAEPVIIDSTKNSGDSRSSSSAR
jgi:hypothetical protein